MAGCCSRRRRLGASPPPARSPTCSPPACPPPVEHRGPLGDTPRRGAGVRLDRPRAARGARPPAGSAPAAAGRGSAANDRAPAGARRGGEPRRLRGFPARPARRPRPPRHRRRLERSHTADPRPPRRRPAAGDGAHGARPLAAGWGGKVNALATGFDSVATPWILLTDADTRHQPELLARAHAAAAEHRLDALSLSGRQVTDGFGESLLTPAAYALLDRMLGDWRPYARGEGATPIANGQYFLLKTEALRTIGGFAAIAGDALDDVALANKLHAGGFKVGFRRAGDALTVRMYRGARATFRGWRRNFALFVAARPAAALAAIALPLATALTMILALAFRGACCFRNLLAGGSRRFRNDPQKLRTQSLYWSLFSSRRSCCSRRPWGWRWSIAVAEKRLRGGVGRFGSRNRKNLAARRARCRACGSAGGRERSAVAAELSRRLLDLDRQAAAPRRRARLWRCAPRPSAPGAPSSRWRAAGRAPRPPGSGTHARRSAPRPCRRRLPACLAARPADRQMRARLGEKQPVVERRAGGACGALQPGTVGQEAELVDESRLRPRRRGGSCGRAAARRSSVRRS